MPSRNGITYPGDDLNGISSHRKFEFPLKVKATFQVNKNGDESLSCKHVNFLTNMVDQVYSPHVASPPWTDESKGDIAAISRGIIRPLPFLPTNTSRCSFRGSSYSFPEGGVEIARCL